MGNPVLCNTLAAGKVINPTIKAVVSHKAVSEPTIQGTAGALGTGVWVQQDTEAGWEEEGRSRAAALAGQIAGRAPKHCNWDSAIMP